MMRMAAYGLLIVGLAFGGWAQADPATPDDLSSLYKIFRPTQDDNEPYTGFTEEGYFRFFLAPGDSALAPENTNKSLDPVLRARQFLTQHKVAFGMKESGFDFTLDRVNSDSGGESVRLNQTYKGIPVFGAQANVAFSADGNVSSVLSDVMRDVTAVESRPLSPALSPEDAQENAKSYVQVQRGSQNPTASTPQVVILDPGVIGTAGEAKLAYNLRVTEEGSTPVDENVFVDAHTGETLLSYTLIHEALSRSIYDLQNSPSTAALPGVLVRTEGGPPVPNIDDADEAYEFLGDTYEFYFNEHGRDGIAGEGRVMRAAVRLDIANAFWRSFNPFSPASTGMMVFGNGFTTDDITSHELTHGVTDFTSNLVYAFESGAINESLSDIWGEFVDLTNGRGEDGEDVRWLMGEESILGAIRSMSDPPQFGDPDRYSRRLILPFVIDNGGVHINSGIGNKLAYLLTDGDEFNTQEITGMGISRVADLFYRAQTQYLTQASNYADLFFALLASTNDLNWSQEETFNFVKAAQAVEIVPAPAGRPLRHLRATPVEGQGNVVLTWKNPAAPQFQSVTVVRRTDDFPLSPSDGTPVYSGSGERFVDQTTIAGNEYYYAIFGTFTGFFAPQFDFTRVVAGTPTPDYLSESFVNGTDLSFSQITYSPVGDWSPAFDTKVPEAYLLHSNYTATYRSNVFELPVRRLNAVSVDVGEDQLLTIPSTLLKRPFPFFGRLLQSITFSANGFITTNEPGPLNYLATDFFANLPSYEEHFEIPRFSYLFSDLSPPTGGDVWIRSLPDKFVITYEFVPEYNRFPRPENTVQVELFYSGHIRVTYLDVSSLLSVVGLSDGNGIPLDPASGGGPFPDQLMSDMSSLSEPSELTIDPIAVQTVNEGQTVLFEVNANPAPDGGAVSLSANNVPFGASFDPATGLFQWPTGLDDSGSYTVEVRATQGARVAAQNVLIIVNSIGVFPSVSDLEIFPEEPVEGQSIQFGYSYNHPDDTPEGASDIYWYRNGFLVSSLTNRTLVPGAALEAGDQWYVAVVPKTIFNVAGEPVFTDTFVISAQTDPDVNGDGKVDSVDIQIVINKVLGKSTGLLSGDVNRDGGVDAADVQSVINSALN